VGLVLLAKHEPFTASKLRSALDKTFSLRDTHALPAELPPPPADWARPYGVLADEVDIVLDMNEGYRRAKAFVDPVLDGVAVGTDQWDVASESWRPAPAQDSLVRITSRNRLSMTRPCRG
jgi:hypothetical protein